MSISRGKAREIVFQDEMIAQMVAACWQLGTPAGYDRELAIYTEDLIGFVKDTQDGEWQKHVKNYPSNPEQKLLERVATQLNKADPNATGTQLRTFGTLGVLRHGVKDRNAKFKLCQFKPEHGLNPDTLARYRQNPLRIVPELVYSPYATDAHMAETGKQAKKWRIDLVLFVNGLPVVTLELKSEFKQSVQNAISQYKKTRPPVDPATKKPEPLLTFKRGALVHFAVSQYEVYMTTRLAGPDTHFLPFNKGTKDGGAGNDVPEDENSYATGYLWQEVLQPDALLNILARFMHLQIEVKEDWKGRKVKKETMIFPRYHQWDVVGQLVDAAKAEGPGNKYLIQHSAGSGKSNSIAWTAHQLSSLYDEEGNKAFQSVIIVTDRTVLDDQLQETIYQFEHVDGVVGRINRSEGDGSKSEKLAQALEASQPIIIVTIQTFPHVLKAIENSTSLRERNYAIIADEAHSSQTGKTARKLKEVLMLDSRDDEDELTSEDILDAAVAARRGSQNLSYFAFTATPKTKTLELFGRLPKPDEAPSKTNRPEAYHVYSMRQAIEEEFILDVLKNYTSYKVAYNLALKIQEADTEVDSKKAKVKLSQWVRLSQRLDPLVTELEALAQPNNGFSDAFEAALTDFYNIPNLAERLEVAPSVTCFPHNLHPLQALLSRETEICCPLSSSLRTPMKDRPVQKAAIWASCDDWYSEMEALSASGFLEASGVETDVYLGSERGRNDFMEMYHCQSYDYVHVIGHGAFDHWELGSSKILVNHDEVVTVDDLVDADFGNQGRRLLCLNICDGGVSDGLGGIQKLGLAPSLASPSQATISHLWPVEPRVAAAFGLTLCRELTSTQGGHFGAFSETLKRVRDPWAQRVMMLREQFEGGIIERLENFDAVDDIFNWGSPVVFQ